MPMTIRLPTSPIDGLQQIIKSLTRITKTTKALIDIIATTDKTKIAAYIVHPNAISEHDHTGIVRKMYVGKFKTEKNLHKRLVKVRQRSFQKEATKC